MASNWKWKYDLKHGGVSEIFFSTSWMFWEGRSFMEILLLPEELQRAVWKVNFDPFFQGDQLDIPRDHLWKISRTRTADLSLKNCVPWSAAENCCRRRKIHNFPSKKSFVAQTGWAGWLNPVARIGEVFPFRSFTISFPCVLHKKEEGYSWCCFLDR